MSAPALGKRPAQRIQVPEESSRSVRVDDDPHRVRSGRQRNARDGDRPPDLPAAGVGHRLRTGDVDTINLDVESSTRPW